MSIVQFFKRFGITTGAAAAAAAKAATVFLLHRVKPSSVTIPTPVGLRLEIPVEQIFVYGDSVCASVRKFSGDNVDVLDGISIVVCVKQRKDDIVNVVGGRGVGIVARSGLQIPVGESAISPTARSMIIEAIREVAKGIGLDVVIEVPNGEEIAKKTLNESLGIVDGISILGTTGIEWPVSAEDDVHRISLEISIVRSRSTVIVLATGNRTFDYASQIYSPEIIVKVGDSVGFAVSEASKAGFSRIVVAIQPSKVLKLSVGIMNTSSRVGDARIEALTHACVAVGLDIDVVKRVSAASSVREALDTIGSSASLVFSYVARKALNHLRRLCSNSIIEILVFSYGGGILARAET
ncbi:MAG: cobalt-precorrin-5B (C(1))-methyltransferase CbiD [Ignisphaera sp.]